MSGFLDRLAGMAIGQRLPGAAAVSLPSRFAPAVDGGAGFVPRMESGEQSTAHSEQPPARPIDASAGALPQQRRGAPGPVEAAPMPRERASRSDVLPSKASVGRAQDAATPVRQVMPVAERPAAVLRQQPPGRTRLREEGGEQSPPAARRTAGTPAIGRTPTLPLGEAALAARSGANRDASPVFNVTIDRIDVRAAPADRPASPPRRARPAATTSLSDYLRRGEPGARR